jgi:general secretion pathway protein I
MIELFRGRKFLRNVKSKYSTLDGFTLLEVIIAMAIMVVAFGSILAVEQGSINASMRAKQMNIVGMLARNQMIETEFKFQGKPFDEVKKEESGVFKTPYEDYRWTTKIKEIKFPKLSAGTDGGGDEDAAHGAGSQAQNNGTGDMVSKVITNYFTKALREVTVTVTWKRGSGEQNFTLATYWVNLNNEFKLSE